MVRGFVYGLILGGAGIYFDAYLMRGLLGLSTPFGSLFLLFLCAMSIVGLGKVEAKLQALGTSVGVPVGLVAVDMLRHSVFGAERVLTSLHS